MVRMVFKDNKRPFSDDDSHKLTCKHPRQLDYGSHLASFEETVRYDCPKNSHISGEESFTKSQRVDGLGCHAATDISVDGDKEFEVRVFGSIPNISWITSSTSEEDSRSEPAWPRFCPAGFIENDRLVKALIPSDEIYSSLLGYPPRKLVSVGPDHQADVPLWGLHSNGNSDPVALDADFHANVSCPSSSVCQPAVVDDGNWEKLVGTCIIPMPDAKLSVNTSGDVGHGRTDCNCPDAGSVRCVRQHVMEAREKLKETIGCENFVELGFSEMGEDVAQRWSEEEEQMFHAVVFSNPASSGKNFWDDLARVFPTRKKKELVSYYFNVFMLRRRAEQNRSSPMNIDSDNDEWQGSDDGGECGMTEEDEDSAVESLVAQEHLVYNGDDACDDCHEDDEDEDEDDDYDMLNDGGGGDDDDDVAASEDDDGGLDDVSEARPSTISSSGKLLDNHSSVSTIQNEGKNVQNVAEDNDLQDDSCTSYECQRNGSDSYGPADAVAAQENQVEVHIKSLNDGYGNGSSASGVHHGCVLEPPCEAKSWDIEFHPRSKDIDFLPTRNMIEEVFGDEARSTHEMRNDPGES